MAVYIASVAGFPIVRIASTKQRPAQHLAYLQKLHPNPVRYVRLMRGAGRDAARLRKRFAGQHTSGSWFRWHPDMEGDLGLRELLLPTLKRAG